MKFNNLFMNIRLNTAKLITIYFFLRNISTTAISPEKIFYEIIFANKKAIPAASPPIKTV